MNVTHTEHVRQVRHRLMRLGPGSEEAAAGGGELSSVEWTADHKESRGTFKSKEAPHLLELGVESIDSLRAIHEADGVECFR